MTRQRPPSAPRPWVSDAFAIAITHELVRLCLGGRPERDELIPSRAELVQHERDRRVARPPAPKMGKFYGKPDVRRYPAGS